MTGFGGGPEKTILNSPRYLPPLGYQAACAYLHPPDESGLESLRGRAEAAKAELITIEDRGPLDWSLVGKFIRLCRQRHVRIWHAHDDKSNALGLLVRMRVPMKLVTTAHGWGANLGLNPWKSRLYRACSQISLRRYEMSIAVSPDLQQMLVDWRLRPERVVLIENAIDTAQFARQFSQAEARRRMGLPDDGLVIAALGRLAPEKGFDALVQAVAAVRQSGRQVNLWIGGEGPLRDALTTLIDQLQVADSVRLLGHLGDPRDFLQAADLFVLSSVSEGLPNVVLEAMALGTPVISTRVAGVPRVIEDGVHGLLVDIGQADPLVDAIIRLVDDAELRRRLASAARQRIEQHYDFGLRMQKVARVYDRMLDRQTSA